MAIDKEFWLTVGVGVAGAVVGWRMGKRLSKTINKLRLDILEMDNRILELELKERLHSEKETHAAKMAECAKKIADTQAHLDALTEQTEKDLAEQAELKEKFANNELTLEQYASALMKFVP